MLRNEFSGIEFDWFATDSRGRVGYFSSAGSGLVPSVVAQNLSAHEMLNSHFEETIDQNDPKRTIDVSDWRRMAALGFYAYDSHPNGGPYQLQAIPEFPRTPDDFPPAVAEALRLLVLPFEFSATSTIEPSRLDLHAA